MSDKKQTGEKFDFKKEYKSLFSPSAREPEMIRVPPFKYLNIDGTGDPGGPGFQDRVGVLYGMAYTLKFMLKKDDRDPFDFTVPPLSGLWCADDPAAFVQEGRRDEWKWTLMILVPDRVTDTLFEEARQSLIKKKNPPLAGEVYFKIYDEGLSAQVMHIGPYSAEGPTIAGLHRFFQERGYTFNGPHHEIYLGDPRKSKPEKLKTIIRQPVKKEGS